MTVKIVTDSASDLPSSTADELGITVVPLTIRFGDDEFVDGRDLSAQEFYDEMARRDVLPATAAPSPGAFEQAFRAAAADGSQVVCINLSSALSATMASAETAAKAVAGELDVTVLDSKSITAGLGRQVLAAATAAAGGATAADIDALVADLSGRTHIFGALNTLDNLKKGGRIGGAQAMIGSMLSIKPIVDISSGKVEEAAKQRTRRKSLVWLRDKVFAEGDRVDEVAICNGCADDVDILRELLSERFEASQLSEWTIGPVIGAHGGPGILGVSWHRPV